MEKSAGSTGAIKEIPIVIGIWGAGIVGSATGHIFEQLCPGKVEVLYYDKYKKPYSDRRSKETLLENSDFIFVCLPTPMKITGEIDMGYVENSFLEMWEYYSSHYRLTPIMIVRSTSVSGSTERLNKLFPFFKISFCPEFLTEKNSLKEALDPKKIIIGSDNPEHHKEIELLFRLAFGERVQYFQLSTKEAETLKYLSNVFLAGQVLLANELFFICEKIGVDYNNLRKALALDDRIGKYTQVPGSDGDFGVGGKCFVKDMNAFVYLAKENEYNPIIMETLLQFNDHIRINKDWLSIKGATSNNSYDKEE